MNFLEKINKENLHHGYLVVGDRNITKSLLFKFLEDELEVVVVGNPDFSFLDFNTLTIDDARDIAINQTKKDFGSDKKIFVVSTNIITDEAQNALLKVFEEPTPGTHFFILASQNTFLPTFLSRLVVIKFESLERLKLESEDKENILDMPVAERLTMVAKLAGDISDEKSVKQDAIALVNKIESELYKLMIDPNLQSTTDGLKKNSKALKECEFARTTLFSRGAMTKMILENLMLQI
jgi:DNA polymerase III gamma/tau subunit